MLIHLSFITLFIALVALSLLDNSQKKAIKFVSLTSTAFVLAYSTLILSKFDNKVESFQEIVTYTLNNSIFNYSLSFGLDGISVYFFFLSALLTFLCVLFVWDEERFKGITLNLIVIEFFLLVIFSSMNLLVFYVFFEAILVPMFVIIGLYGSRQRKIRAVYLFFFYTLISSILMLVILLYIYSSFGTFDVSKLLLMEIPSEVQNIMWIAFFLSFATKIPMFPFHIWLPEAHVEAPTVGSVLLAGILLKLGVYGFLRFSITLFTDASFYFQPLVFTLAIIGVIFASLSALSQTDLKRIIAYSSVAHMNLVILGIFSFDLVGIEGSILQSLSHGFVSGGMFLLVGILYNRYHTRFISYYGGLVHFMPIYAIIFLIFTLANIALPGTSSFVGEFLLLLGVYKYNATSAILAALGVILSGSYSLWLYNRVMFGNLKLSYTQLFKDVSYLEFSVMLPLLFFVFLIGIFPDYILSYLHLSSNYIYLVNL